MDMGFIYHSYYRFNYYVDRWWNQLLIKNFKKNKKDMTHLPLVVILVIVSYIAYQTLTMDNNENI